MGTETDTDHDTTRTATDNIHTRLTQLRQPTVALTVILTLTALAGAVARFVALDARPVHYDEGVHLLYAWRLLTEGTYTYTGYSHGPVLIYASALLFELGGPDITLARGLVALCSLGLFPALYLLREEFPPVTLAVAATVFAVHPWLLYTARFYRNDAIVAAAGLLALGCYARARRRAQTQSQTTQTADADGWVSDRRLVGLAIALGIATTITMAAKEIGYLVVAAPVAALLVVVHFDARFSPRSWLAAQHRYLPATVVAVAGATTLAGFVALFSGWPPQPTQAPTYWLDGIEVWLTRSSGDAYDSEVTYYVGRLARETPVVFGLALVGCLGALRPRASWLRWPLVAWVGFVGLVLSFHDHQWLWLMTHVFVPVTVLAGCGVADLAALATAVLARTPRVVDDVRAQVREWRPKPPSEWGTPDPAPRATDGDGWVAWVRSPTARTVLTLAVAALVVAPVLLGAAAGDPMGVDGVTASGERDVERAALTHAASLAGDSGCEVVLGPDVSAHPAAWYLRDTPDSTVAAWNASTVDQNAILVGRSDLEATLANASESAWTGTVETVDAESAWYVAQPASCGG